MRIVAYLCLSFCLLSFDIHASSAPLVIKQGIEKQEFTVAITNEAKPVVEFEIEEDGLLIIEVKQRGHFLYERLWIDGKPQAYMDMFGFSEGSDFVSLEVTQNNSIELEILKDIIEISMPEVSVVSYIFPSTAKDYNTQRELFEQVNKLGVDSYINFYINEQSSGFNTNKLIDINLKILAQLKFLDHRLLKDYLNFNLAILLSDIDKRRESVDILKQLKSQSRPDSVELLSNYYFALLFPDYLSESELLKTIERAINLAKNYNQYLYENARLDMCTALQQQSSVSATTCYQNVLDEELLKTAPIEQSTLQSNLAQLYFSKNEFIKSIELGESAIKTLSQIKDNSSLKREFKIKKAIYDYQQALRLKSLGLNNDALLALLKAIRTFTEYSQYQFKMDSLMELSRLYLIHGHPKLARYIIQYVISKLDHQTKSDHFHLFYNAYNIAIKSAISLGKESEAEYYLDKLQPYIRTFEIQKVEEKLKVELIRHQISPTSDSSERVFELLKSVGTLHQIYIEDLLYIIQLSLQGRKLKLAQNLLLSISNKQLNFVQSITVLKLKGKLAYENSKYYQAEKWVDLAIKLIEKQHKKLTNIGLKRNYYSQFKDIYHLKTRILVQKYQTTNDSKFLVQASDLNLPQLPIYRQLELSSSATIKRQKLANDMSSLPMNSENTIEIISKLLALENNTNDILYRSQKSEIATMNTTLSESSALTLHYVLMPEWSILIVRKIDEISFKILSSEAVINQSILKVFKAITTRQADAFTLTKKLSDLLLPTDLSSKNNKIKNINIVGSGLIWQLPFSMLPINNASDWHQTLAVDKYTFSKVLSLSSSKFSPNIKRILTFSDPIFSAQDSRVKSSNRTINIQNDLARLASGKTEVESLKKIFTTPIVTEYSGFKATKTNFIKQISRNSPQIIHIASHSFIHQEDYRNAGIHFTRIEPNTLELDSVLKLQEIEVLENNAELVVLSACKSNVGNSRFRSPIDGLAIAFLSSGANRVIASQWEIPSRATSLLMSEFYRHLHLEKNTPLALNKAQQQVRTKYKDPFYWAGFTVTSNAKELQL